MEQQLAAGTWNRLDLADDGWVVAAGAQLGHPALGGGNHALDQPGLPRRPGRWLMFSNFLSCLRAKTRDIPVCSRERKCRPK